jgi:hypothetical protein
MLPALFMAATITVTTADDYKKIEAAKAGDEVVIAPGKYNFRVFLTQQGPANAPIVIRAQDPKNPRLQTGTPPQALTGSIFGSSPMFGASNRLAGGSPAIGAAASVQNTPITEYYLDDKTTRMYRVRANDSVLMRRAVPRRRDRAFRFCSSGNVSTSSQWRRLGRKVSHGGIADCAC